MSTRSFKIKIARYDDEFHGNAVVSFLGGTEPAIGTRFSLQEFNGIHFTLKREETGRIIVRRGAKADGAVRASLRVSLDANTAKFMSEPFGRTEDIAEFDGERLKIYIPRHEARAPLVSRSPQLTRRPPTPGETVTVLFGTSNTIEFALPLEVALDQMLAWSEYRIKR